MKPTFARIQEEIANMLDVPDEQLNDEQRAAMDDYLNILADQEAEKIDGVAQFVTLQAKTVDALKEESRRLAAKAKTMENRIAWLKNQYVAIMRQNGLKKVRGKIYDLSLRQSESVRVPVDLNELDAAYLRRKEVVEADKVKIKEALKNGAFIPGCELTQSFSLQIR